MFIYLLLVLFIHLFTKYKSQGQCGIYLGCSSFENKLRRKKQEKQHPRKIQTAFTLFSIQDRKRTTQKNKIEKPITQ